MNNRLLISLMVIGFVGAGLGGTTMAMFNDTETSADNKFVSGELDLLVDWEESYNGEEVEIQELTNNPGRIFNLSDIKPGDHGEATVSLHLDDNPGWIWMNMNQTANEEGMCTEPEARAESQEYQKPVLHLPLDDSTEDKEMGNDASLRGVSSYEAGKKKKSISFSGNGYGVVNHTSNYELEEGSISFWIKPDQEALTAYHRGIIGKDAAGNRDGGHIYVSIRDGKPHYRIQDTSNSYEIQSDSQLTAGEWHHVVASFGSQGQKLYVDGDEVASSSYTGGISNNSEPLVFGASPYASDEGKPTPVERNFLGDLDEIKLNDHQYDSSGPDSACGDKGELGEHLKFTIWSDDGDNVLQDDENVIFEGTAHELSELNMSGKGILLDGNPSTDEVEAFPGGETSHIGIKWKVPLETGNEIQGDSKKFDISFYTEQRRHNPEPVEYEATNWQVDLIEGEPMEDLSESTYSDRNDLERYGHGLTNGTGPYLAGNTGQNNQVECIESSSQFEVDGSATDAHATVEFEIEDSQACEEVNITHVSYRNTGDLGWSGGQNQELFDSNTVEAERGESYDLEVDLPSAEPVTQ